VIARVVATFGDGRSAFVMAGFEDAMFESVVLGVRSRIIDFKEVGMRYGRADNQKCGGHMRARMLLGK
jgi:hypothetical protein